MIRIFKAVIYRFIKIVAYKLGYITIPKQRIEPVDFRRQENDSRYFFYQCIVQPFLIDVPISNLLALPLFSFQSNDYHPFVIAAKKAKISNNQHQEIKYVLSKFYDLFRPENANQLLGISNTDSRILSCEPAWMGVMPWDEPIEIWRKAQTRSVHAENKQCGIDETIEKGWAWSGPISNDKISIETKRLSKLLSSIENNGYIRNNNTDGDIVGFKLIDSDNKWKVIARTGQHRAAVLGALGWHTVPVKIRKIIYRDEFDIWPNVLAGVFSKEVALKIFDSVFENKRPEATQTWCEFVDSTLRAEVVNDNWSIYDFQVNKYFWANHGQKKAMPIRKKNLLDLAQVLNECDIHFWLQGKTLLGVYNYRNLLLDDHDDDIAVFEKDILKINNEVKGKLNSIGFKTIRNNKAMISFLRDNRYIDVCIFREKHWGKVGYAQKSFSKKHFLSFNNIDYEGFNFAIPSQTKSLLQKMYPSSKLKQLETQFIRSFVFSRYIGFYKRIVNKIGLNIFKYSQFVSNIILRTAGVECKIISEDEFLELRIEPVDSFNWKWRKPHIDIVTNNGKHQRVYEIVDYFKRKDPKSILSEIVETDTSSPFYDPHNYDERFWQSGNNYFIYCVLFQFKKNVLPYSQVNDYIKAGQKPEIFTRKYYEALKDQSEDEITLMLQEQPIEINRMAITSGKHRAFAMIGRLVSGKPYIPFKVINKKRK